MKTKTIRSDRLMSMWRMSIEMTFFPDALFNELRPDIQVEAWGDDLPAVRENLRIEVDDFIGQIFDCYNGEELWSCLRETDPKIAALYFDRLNTATVELQEGSRGHESSPIPESWPTFVAQLLLRRRPQ